MSPDILLVDDDPAFVKIVTKVLSAGGFHVASAASGKAGIRHAQEHKPSLIVLDLVMPGLRGLEVCQALKQDHQTADIPILILTGSDKDGQEIACLDMGADDYLTKPAKGDRLMAHCRALLRRAPHQEESKDGPLTLDGLSLDYPRKVVRLGTQEFPHLTPKEFELLHYLARHRPRPCDRAELYREVWGTEAPSETSLRTVEVHVRRIRLKLAWKSDQWLVTIPGRGYCLTPP